MGWNLTNDKRNHPLFNGIDKILILFELVFILNVIKRKIFFQRRFMVMNFLPFKNNIMALISSRKSHSNGIKLFNFAEL